MADGSDPAWTIRFLTLRSDNDINLIVMQRFDDEPAKSEQELIAAIEHHLAHMGNYPMWTIGATTDPDGRYADLSEPAFWAHWQAQDEDIALRVEKHFIEKGMREDRAAQAHPTFVYIF